MKSVLIVTLMTCMSGSAVLAQTDRQAGNGVNAQVRDTDQREHHNWGWMGLVGLAGLAGLRRKSEFHSQLESQGVNVKTVKA
jgi:MYXO-CTERM domain-containing protein